LAIERSLGSLRWQKSTLRFGEVAVIDLIAPSWVDYCHLRVL